MIKLPPPPPDATGFLHEEATAEPRRSTLGRRPNKTWRRWFQQLVQNPQPEFANEELTGAVNGVNKIFGIPTAAPNPTSSLMLYNGATFVQPTAYYILDQQVVFYTAPTGGPLFAAYRY
jgi:hypothetical protein